MQQLRGSGKFYPEYADKLVFFFTISGEIMVKVGNQFVIASDTEAAKLLEARLVQHAKFCTLFDLKGGSNGA